jgi:dTDP-4-dehydrorhamnose reductase
MKILIFGAAGQLGSDLVTVLSRHHETFCPGHRAVAVEDEKSVSDCVSSLQPQLIINAAAIHDVEKCESLPLQAFSVNALGPLYLSRAANSVGASFYQISTDYVFGGRQSKPYKESDPPAPCNIYGHSKLAGERFALGVHAGGYVLRVGGLYGAHPCRGKGGRNFIRTMLEACARRPEIAVVDDEVITPTCTMDVARQLSCMIASRLPSGIYHVTSQGKCSWFGFAKEIFSLLQLSTPLRPARAGEFPAKTPRPAMSVLDNAALANAHMDMMPRWQDALREFIASNETTISRWRAEGQVAASP